MSKGHVFTHVGTVSGDARNGNRSRRVSLRLTPSGSHWVDVTGRRYRRTGGGYVGNNWPLWFLDADSIQEVPASVGRNAKRQDPQGLGPKDEHAVPSDSEGDAQ